MVGRLYTHHGSPGTCNRHISHTSGCVTGISPIPPGVYQEDTSHTTGCIPGGIPLIPRGVPKGVSLIPRVYLRVYLRVYRTEVYLRVYRTEGVPKEGYLCAEWSSSLGRFRRI